MGRKKAKQLPDKRGVTKTFPPSPWPDIPNKIRDIIFRNYGSHTSSGAGAAKSWKLSSKRCHPTSSLVPQLCHTIDRETQEYMGGYKRANWHTYNFPPSHTELSILNPYNFDLSLIVTGFSHPPLVYHKRTTPCENANVCSLLAHDQENHKWVTKYFRTLVDPHCLSQEYMQFGNAIGFDGKVYMLSLHGTLVIIEEVDFDLVITHVSTSRAVPSVPSRHFREYMIESNGQIFLIFLISLKSTNTVDDVEIFRLQMFPKLAWKKVERMGDNVVFVGEKRCCVVNASELGCKGNCVFFTNRGAVGWLMYDMVRGNISSVSWSSESSEHSVQITMK